MGRVFLSYRRDDTQYITGFIRQQLEDPDALGAGSTFMDLDDIPPGVDFRTFIRQAVNQCDFFLVIIGKQWASIPGDDGRPRLFDPNDFVRLEIEAALLRKIPVTPVLVDRAALPFANQLPPSLRPLLFLQAVTIRPNSDFRPDTFRLVEGLHTAAKWYRENGGAILHSPDASRFTEVPPKLAGVAPEGETSPPVIRLLAGSQVELSRADSLSRFLAKAISLRDEYTGGHSQRVTRYALALAERLDLPNDQVELIRTGTPLHDIGKIGIPDEILRKPGKLTSQEFAVMQTHTTLGAEYLSTIPELHPVIPIVRNHHERWDGRGYPDGLAKQDIPRLARVVAVCDAYDAMTASRPYHSRGLGPEQAFLELSRQAGVAFDPECIEAFLAIRDEILAAV